ncbi:protein TonB [Desulfomicrobium norvegicum]|uniref:Protein TonB n=1 Tax=Desulfomicrobium norvegicum (strain DSM 1741 / NCIMB 8310) TaxID=52561 RepID=A0A8G2C022_DESNO|nr:energy transducer TonB [Desulfomicrobium norvegicum]SFL30079.1 protein TonB [Desulfomicrobium norvegicum]
MSNLVGITDPACLDVPELGQCECYPLPPAPEGSAPRGSGFSTLACLGMAMLLHGLIFLLGLTLPVNRALPDIVLGISLVSGIPDAGPPPGPAENSGPPVSVSSSTEPVRETMPMSPVVPAVQKPRSVKAKPGKPVRVVKTDAPKVQEKPAPPAEAKQSGPVALESAANDNSNGELQSTATGPTAVSGPLASISDGLGGGHGEGHRWPMEASFGDADGPRFIQRVMPKYPELARRRGREGLVVLRLVIGPGGDLRDAQVVEGGGHGFDEAALAAVRASVYAPATRGGRGMECAALLPIRFALKGS